MANLSIVIVCKNESNVISATLKMLEGVTDDVIVYDSGSTDDTMEIVKKFPVQLHSGNWEGFGRTKNKANALAKYDWILSLDADEGLDETLRHSLKGFIPPEDNIVYKIRFSNFLGDKELRHGEWGKDWHTRLFNRRKTSWDEEPVHEKLVLAPGTLTGKVQGSILHHTATSIYDYAEKMVKYAMLNAEKYKRMGKRSSWLKIHFSPAFSFFSNYILKAGFLDGHEGYVCAKMTAYYTFLKYTRLKELYNIVD